MSDLSNGMLVRHRSLGMGRVVAVEATAVHVFFPASEKRHAAKLRWPMARPLLQTEGLARDSWLEGLSSFALDDTGRYALAESWISHDQAVVEFLGRCPGGFAAEPASRASARTSRSARWRAAHLAWVEQLGGGRGEALLAAGKLGALVDRALRVADLAVPLEEGALKEAFRNPEANRAFFGALFELLSVPSPGRARFEKLFVATAGLEAAPPIAWAVATLFPFVAEPARHLVLWPKSARAALERLGCDLRYDAEPNWTTYAALRNFAGKLLERLTAIGARDLADVEAFLFAVATRRAAPGRRGEPEEAPPRAAARRSAATIRRPRERASARSR